MTEKALKRMSKIYQHSRCQRDAFVFAVPVEWRWVARGYLSQYKWYHVLPNWAYSNPGYILTYDFWRTFFK